MAYLVQQFVKNSLLLSLTILVCWLHVTDARAEQLKHTRPSDSMPDELHVTFTGESGTSSGVQLRLLQHSVPDVPVYSLEVDENGQHVTHLEELEVNPNVAYYHDLNNNAVMQVTRKTGRGDREAHFELQGDLTIKGQKYLLNIKDRFKRESSSSSEADPYTLVPQEPPRFAKRDHIPAPSQVWLQVVETEREINQDLRNIFARKNVHRRQVKLVMPIFIDVAAVIDYVAYSRFRAISRSKREADKAIRLYYALIFSGVDLMYKNIWHPTHPISVRLIKIVILKTAATSQVTLQFQLPNLNQTDEDKALNAFMLYCRHSKKVMNPNDHAMLFSGYVLVSVDINGTVHTDVGGSAYGSRLCQKDGSSVSIIEDYGQIHTVVYVAAHELGHSLGSNHDQDGNTCQEADGFIMTPQFRPVTPTNKYNGWLFSNCSINYFITYITETLKTRRGARCLLGGPPPRNVPDVSGRLPGQEYSVHQQCTMIHGSGSFMCPSQEPPADVCTRLLCFNPSNNICYDYKAAVGTTCGNNKWCIRGECVYDHKAPAVDDACVFADPLGVAFDGQTCSQYVNDYSGYCYQSGVRDYCCRSCKAAYRNVTGCEYGDTLRGCVSNMCSFLPGVIRRQCCRTCPRRRRN